MEEREIIKKKNGLTIYTISPSYTGRKASATPDLYNSEKLCISFGYVKCKGKWDCEERGSSKWFRKGNFELLAMIEGKEWVVS